MKDKIAAMATTPVTAKRFADPMLMIGLSTALIMVLKTSFDIERDKSGKWKIQIKSKAADKSVIEAFVKKLLSWIPSGPFGK